MKYQILLFAFVLFVVGCASTPTPAPTTAPDGTSETDCRADQDRAAADTNQRADQYPAAANQYTIADYARADGDQHPPPRHAETSRNGNRSGNYSRNQIRRA